MQPVWKYFNISPPDATVVVWEFGIESQGKIQEMVRKEKAYMWGMREVSKREGLAIRLWALLGQPGKLIYLFSTLCLRHLRDLKCQEGRWICEAGTRERCGLQK